MQEEQGQGHVLQKSEIEVNLEESDARLSNLGKNLWTDLV